MVVLGGLAVSYERGTPVILALRRARPSLLVLRRARPGPPNPDETPPKSRHSANFTPRAPETARFHARDSAETPVYTPVLTRADAC
ncbi:hypothetical protein T484DRAFT_3230545 [Baffinella frigidus]|nr:hypothetical protein T484DRAFT_3230545 [Cryptophyta sp. CCMP2293]